MPPSAEALWQPAQTAADARKCCKGKGRDDAEGEDGRLLAMTATSYVTDDGFRWRDRRTNHHALRYACGALAISANGVQLIYDPLNNLASLGFALSRRLQSSVSGYRSLAAIGCLHLERLPNSHCELHVRTASRSPTQPAHKKCRR